MEDEEERIRLGCVKTFALRRLFFDFEEFLGSVFPLPVPGLATVLE